MNEIKQLIAFSATEVLRGSAGYATEVRFLEQVLVERFDETFPTVLPPEAAS